MGTYNHITRSTTGKCSNNYLCFYSTDLCLSRKFCWGLIGLGAEDFLHWTADQTREVKFASLRKVPRKNVWKSSWKSRQIPAGYIRLIDQLQLEDGHGEINQGHEAQCRKSYAQRVLDQLGEELQKVANPGPQWRSKVLTPILQQQLQGVPNAYAPAIEAAVSADEDGDKVTILDATLFYLDRDPLNPAEILNYRRNMIYIREMKWHLSMVMGEGAIDDVAWYNKTLHNHDILMRTRHFPEEGNGIPPFSKREVAFIVYACLEDYLEHELQDLELVSKIPFPL